MKFVNLSFYRFLPLPGTLPEIRARLKAFCLDVKLKGTILLAPEGINGGLCGSRASVDAFKNYISTTFKVPNSAFKESLSDKVAYTRMLVKIKKEIIPVGDPTLRPHEETGKRLSSAELKQWIDEGRRFILLDTRNRYEIEVGTFQQASDLSLDHSRDFLTKAASWAEQVKQNNTEAEPIVTFCTGGIRCEKASAALLKLGLKNVFQLEGGILRYFEEQGGAHFNGNCFVFDWRLAVDEKLEPVNRSEDAEGQVEFGAQFGRHQIPVQKAKI